MSNLRYWHAKQQLVSNYFFIIVVVTEFCDFAIALFSIKIFNFLKKSKFDDKK